MSVTWGQHGEGRTAQGPELYVVQSMDEQFFNMIINWCELVFDPSS